MKSSEGFPPPQTEVEKAEQEIAPKSLEIEVAKISNEQLEQYTISAESHIEQQTAEILPEGEKRLESSSSSMNVSPETLDSTKQEFGLDAKLQEVRAEADQIASEAVSDIGTIGQELQQESPDIENSEFIKSPDRKETVLGFEREDLSGIIQRARGKENIRYVSSEGQEFFTKYVNKQEGNRDNIAGLKNEKHFLDLLDDSGVTPKTSELKIYPNEKRARLSIEQVPGVSLDKMDDEKANEFLKEKAEATIHSTAEALEKIHQKNVLLVDVNEGSFLLDEKDEKISTHVVDFELAVDLDKKIPREREGAFRWYANKDLALHIDEKIDHQDAGVLKKAEVSRWARTLAERMIGFNDISKSVELPPEKQKEFDEMKVTISPILEKQVIERAKKDYEYESKIPKEERFYDLPTEEDFVQKEIERELPHKVEEELLGITLEEKMKAKGIVVSEKTLDFISRALSLKLKNRPANFSELKR